MPTKDELQVENDRLRARVAELESGTPSRPVPVEPSFGLCEGTRTDLELAEERVRGGYVKEAVVSSPFTGQVIERFGTAADDDTGAE